MLGQVLGGRYEIRQQLGKKAGRKTFLAYDRQTQSSVVIKLLTFGTDFEWDDLKLFEREAETLQSLAHPAIPRYLNHFELDSTAGKGFALVQTYIEAHSLEEHLKAGRVFSELEVKELAQALLEILIYLHGQNPPVIHRDIKPSNILLSDRSGNSVGKVYLVDFGSVQTLAAREGGTITVVGTYGYMPPEQFGGRAVPASDLYSLGATLIYVMTGLHPADLPQVDLRIQFEQAITLSPELKGWLKAMTEPSLNRRPKTAQEALDLLESPVAPMIQGDVVHPVRQQPIGSQVRFTREADGINIVIPPEGFRWGTVSLLCFTLFCDSLILISLPYVFPFFLLQLFALQPFGVLLVLCCWGAGFGLSLKTLFCLFGNVHLQLNQYRLTLTYELFGLKVKYADLPRSIICKLLYRKGHYRMVQQNEIAVGSYVKDTARIIVWGGTKSYEFCNATVLTEPELDWLAYELSQSLELPVARD